MHCARRASSMAVALLLLAGGARADDLRRIDLSGEWYVLLHYSDSRSRDAGLTKFKDFAWSIEQGEAKIAWKTNPYVIFDEGTEVTRRHKMRAHEPWQPEGMVLGLLRDHMDVSSRAETSKRLRGTSEQGFRSLPAIGGGGARTLTFSRDWTVTFAQDRVAIRVVDSLGGSDLLGEMEEATLYEITEVSPGELHGSYAEGMKSGTLRMIRSKERRVVK